MNSVQLVEKEPESLAIIRFQDCDPLGHLNNARYFDYFFNARQDQLAQFYDFHIFEWGKTHSANWVVTQHQIAYLRPALVMEEVILKTCLIHFTDTVLLVEGLMFDKAKTRLKALLWTEFTYVSMVSGKTNKHPDELLEFSRNIALENNFWAEGFSRRVEQLKKLLIQRQNTQ